DLWASLLRRVPRSVLWLIDTQPGRESLRREAAARGLAPERLVFAPRLPQAEHLGPLALADLALDTPPFTSHTTASDALWAGVPVVSCAGKSFAARVAASCLVGAGLSELVTRTKEESLELAHRLATRREELAAVRARLETGRERCPLFDTAATTR